MPAPRRKRWKIVVVEGGTALTTLYKTSELEPTMSGMVKVMETPGPGIIVWLDILDDAGRHHYFNWTEKVSRITVEADKEVGVQ